MNFRNYENNEAIYLLEDNLDKVDWDKLSINPSLFEINGYLIK